MPADFVLRTVYIDPDLDEELRRRAANARVSKAALFRRFLVAGMRAARAQPALLDDARKHEKATPLILQTVGMDPAVDHKLRVEAFDTRTSKYDLTRRYLRVGLSTS